MDLRTYLFHKRISIADFSRQLKCSTGHLSRIVNGKLKPSQRLAEDIARATNGEVTVQELLGE
jgi:hypothetical protein